GPPSTGPRRTGRRRSTDRVRRASRARSRAPSRPFGRHAPDRLRPPPDCRAGMRQGGNHAGSQRRFPGGLTGTRQAPPSRRKEGAPLDDRRVCPKGLVLAAVLAVLAARTAAVAGPNYWTPIGPDGGVVSALASDPIHPATLFAGTTGGGVFTSANAG